MFKQRPVIKREIQTLWRVITRGQQTSANVLEKIKNEFQEKKADKILSVFSYFYNMNIKSGLKETYI